MSDPTMALMNRRRLLRAGAVTLSSCSLMPFAQKLRAATEEKVSPRGTAECVIFVNLVGGPSQMDTFDVKEFKSTPQDLDIRTAPTGCRWPYGLLPKTGEVLGDMVLVRSMAAGILCTTSDSITSRWGILSARRDRGKCRRWDRSLLMNSRRVRSPPTFFRRSSQ